MNGYKNHPNNVCRFLVKKILGKHMLKKPALAVELTADGKTTFYESSGLVYATVDPSRGAAAFATKTLNDLGRELGLPFKVGLGLFTPDGRATFIASPLDQQGAA
uniref:hypothetical protein n=1 Tax=Altererythrobacter segetis TaxID=1104773 RepID=UPI001409C7C1|nr:hypothetical protein [Altererythrobacter segetis]